MSQARWEWDKWAIAPGPSESKKYDRLNSDSQLGFLIYQQIINNSPYP